MNINFEFRGEQHHPMFASEQVIVDFVQYHAAFRGFEVLPLTEYDPQGREIPGGYSVQFPVTDHPFPQAGVTLNTLNELRIWLTGVWMGRSMWRQR